MKNRFSNDSPQASVTYEVGQTISQVINSVHSLHCSPLFTSHRLRTNCLHQSVAHEDEISSITTSITIDVVNVKLMLINVNVNVRQAGRQAGLPACLPVR